MKTQKIYYVDSYRQQFNARVLDEFKDRELWIAVLNKTCFYPEGGGQPSDRGWLNHIPVVDVRANNGTIYHYLTESLSSSEVSGKIDFDRRFDFMQQHTGQHIISASLAQIRNYQTLSVHFGEEYTTVEIDAADIPDKDVADAELLANKIISENLHIKVYWIGAGDIQKMPLRKIPPDLKKIRVVEIDNFDYSACGGTHVSRTGEVKLIKFIKREKIRQRQRLIWKIGNRALADYQMKDQIIARLSRDLTCGISDIIPALNGLQEKIKLQYREISELQEQLGWYIVQDMIRAAEKIRGCHLIIEKFEDAKTNWPITLMEILRSGEKNLILFLNLNGNQLQWFFGQSPDMNLDLRRLSHPFLSLIDGKGGGNSGLIQGGGRNLKNIDVFIENIRDAIIKEITNE